MHTTPRLLLDSLKRCPLCEAVNAEASPACFVCGWAGEFARDPDELQASFDALIAQCPNLAELTRKPTWGEKVRSALRSFLQTRCFRPSL